MTTLNNKKLKKLLKSKSRVKIEQNPDVFYKEFLKSTLFIPVIAVGDEDTLEDGDTLDLQIGFFDSIRRRDLRHDPLGNCAKLRLDLPQQACQGILIPRRPLGFIILYGLV